MPAEASRARRRPGAACQARSTLRGSSRVPIVDGNTKPEIMPALTGAQPPAPAPECDAHASAPKQRLTAGAGLRQRVTAQAEQPSVALPGFE
jgi:hypothetical protein